MKKSRLILACLVVAVALGGLTGCMWPKYGLSFEFEYVETPSEDLSTAICTVTNTGTDDVENVQIAITVVYDNFTSDVTGFISVGDLASGQHRDVYVDFYHTGSTKSIDLGRVDEVLWDVAD